MHQQASFVRSTVRLMCQNLIVHRGAEDAGSSAQLAQSRMLEHSISEPFGKNGKFRHPSSKQSATTLFETCAWRPLRIR